MTISFGGGGGGEEGRWSKMVLCRYEVECECGNFSCRGGGGGGGRVKWYFANLKF